MLVIQATLCITMPYEALETVIAPVQERPQFTRRQKLLAVVATVIVLAGCSSSDHESEEPNSQKPVTTEQTAPASTTETSPAPTAPPTTVTYPEGEPPNIISHGPRDKAEVALTVDDGPSAHTAELLDLALDLSIPLTFCLVGREVVSHSATLIQRMTVEGHELCNHTWSHADLAKLEQQNSQTFQKEIVDTDQAISSASGQPPPTLVRPPYGANRDASGKEVIGWPLLAMGKQELRWDTDGMDWDNQNASDVACHTILDKIQPGSIVLMHDTDDGFILNELPCVLDGLHRAGLTPVTVSQLAD